MEILDEVLQAEERASEMLQEARATASKRKIEVDRELGEQVSVARSEARTAAGNRIETARMKLQSAHEEALVSLARNNEEFLKSSSETEKALIGRIVELLSTPEHRKD